LQNAGLVFYKLRKTISISPPNYKRGGKNLRVIEELTRNERWLAEKAG